LLNKYEHAQTSAEVIAVLDDMDKLEKKKK